MDNIPQTLEEAQKNFRAAQEGLVNSDEGIPSGEEPVDQAEYLSDMDKKLASLSKLPSNSKEALEMYGGDREEEGEPEEEEPATEEAEEPYAGPDEEDTKNYKDFESTVSGNRERQMQEHLWRLEQENNYLRQADVDRQRLIQESEERADRAEIEIDVNREKQLVNALHEAFVDGNAAAQTRLTNELADFKASLHSKALMRAFTKMQAENKSVPAQQPTYSSNVGGYEAVITPHNWGGQQQEQKVQDIPPPRISRTPPPAQPRKVSAPSGRAAPKTLSIDKDEMKIIHSMPWKGSDGRPLSYEDKKKLYLASQGSLRSNRR